MGFLKGHTKEINTTPNDIRGLRGNLASQFQQGLNGNALAQSYQGVFGGGPPPAQDTSFFYQNLLKPYTDLFAAQRGEALGQAKESAGNLTGSGYNNILGSSLASSLAGQQALTAQTLMGLRQQELQRQQAFLNSMLGFASQGVGPNQLAYQPGALDYLLPGLGQLGGKWAAAGFPLPGWLHGGDGGQPGGLTSNPFGAPGSQYGGYYPTGNPFGAPGTSYSGYTASPYAPVSDQWGPPSSLRLGRR